MEHVRELDPRLLLLMRGKHVDDAIDALGGRLGVQGGEHEMPRLRGGEGRLDGRHVPHLTHEDDVGILTQGGPQGARERQRVDPHLALDDDARSVLEEILDGILQGHDVELSLVVHPVQQRGDGGGLALARRSRDEHETALELGQVDHGGRQADLLGGRDLVGYAPEGRGHGAALLEDVDPEAREAGDAVGEVAVQPLREGLLLFLRHDGEDHCLALLGRQLLLVEGDELARDAEHGREPHLEVDVGGVPLDGHPEDFLELDQGRGSFRSNAIKAGPPTSTYRLAAKLLEAFQGQGQKCRHHARIEMSARAALDLRARRRDGNGARVRAIVRHGVESVGHREDARAQGDVLAPEPVGIAGAVPALVVMIDDGDGVPEKRHVLDETAAHRGMRPHDLPFVGGQRPRLEEDAVGNGDLADVMEHDAVLDVGELALRHAVSLGEGKGVDTHALRVGARAGVARLEHVPERREGKGIGRGQRGRR